MRRFSLGEAGSDVVSERFGRVWSMESQLKKTWIAMVAPAGTLLLMLYYLQRFRGIDVHPLLLMRPWIGPFLMMGAVLFALVFPIGLRMVMVYRTRDAQGLDEEEFLDFEIRSLRLALVAPYFAVAAGFFGVSRVLLGVSAISALYAVYYFYPSLRRLQYERRIFRVKK